MQRLRLRKPEAIGSPGAYPEALRLDTMTRVIWYRLCIDDDIVALANPNSHRLRNIRLDRNEVSADDGEQVIVDREDKYRLKGDVDES